MEETERRRDVQSLAVEMAKLSVLMEAAEKNRQDELVERRVMRHDINVILQAIQGITLLKDQITALQANMSKDVAESIAKSTTGISDLRAAVMEKVSKNSELIASHEVRIKSLEERNVREDGADGQQKETAVWVKWFLGVLATVVTIGVSLYGALHTGVISGE